MRLLLAPLMLLLAACAPAPTAGAPLSDWAAVIVAGDDHAGHSGGATTETFDNARRDLATAFEAKGFSAANLRQFSLRPERYPPPRPLKTDAAAVLDTLRGLSAKASGGCLVYFTSHGSPEGIVVGNALVAPLMMRMILDKACGERPSVVILSACFSGVFVPALKKDDRMILTAARRDRSSFGCSESDKYPYFDACMLQVLPAAPDFPSLGPRVQACVARREREEGARPASQPQVWVGKRFRAEAPAFGNGAS